MILATLYLLLFLFLIYKNNFFNLLKDDKINSKLLCVFFALKIIAVPVFYVIYKKLYGGIEKFDSGKFFADAKTINSIAYSNITEFIKLIFGFQNDEPGTIIYDKYIINTTEWDNGRIKDYLYNDNRIIIRIHAFLNFLAFGSYYVHALFSCFLSFIGITYLYKSLKDFFKGKEIFVLFIICFLPSLWFYTGALLKEGIVVFILGNLLFTLKKFFSTEKKIGLIIWLLCLVFISALLKPYLLIYALILFSLFYWVYYSKKVNRKPVVFIVILLTATLALNTLSIIIKNKSFFEAALSHQKVFADAAKGGIFLLDSVKFVRLEYDSNLVQKVKNKPNYFKIKKNVPFIYWEHSHQADTLYKNKNEDTTSEYKLVYQLAKSGSNIAFNYNSKNIIAVVYNCYYYSLFYPLFYNSKSVLQHLASVENLFIIFSIIIIAIGLFKNKKNHFPPLAFIIFGLGLCLLIGLTTPNSGAIFRYRSPAVIFILLAALYYLPISKKSDKQIS